MTTLTLFIIKKVKKTTSVKTKKPEQDVFKYLNCFADFAKDIFFEEDE